MIFDIQKPLCPLGLLSGRAQTRRGWRLPLWIRLGWVLQGGRSISPGLYLVAKWSEPRCRWNLLYLDYLSNGAEGRWVREGSRTSFARLWLASIQHHVMTPHVCFCMRLRTMRLVGKRRRTPH